MTLTRLACWTLLAALGFGLAVPATARQDKNAPFPKMKDEIRTRVNELRDNPKPLNPSELKQAQQDFELLAKYLAAVVADTRIYTAAQEFNPSPLIPKLDDIVRSFEGYIRVPAPGNRVGPDDADYIRELGIAVDKELGEVVRNSSDRIVRVNAARLLASACRSGAAVHYPTVTALLANANTPAEVKYYALKAAENLLAAYDLNDIRSRKHSNNPKKANELAELVQAIEDCIVKPNTLVAGGAAGADGKVPAMTADQQNVVAFIRRQAVKALGQLRFATIPGPTGAPIYPAHTLTRVIESDPAVVPPPGEAEVAEAVIGLCNMAPSKGYVPEVAADAVATGVIAFASKRSSNPADKSIAWRGYAGRMSEALKLWKGLFDGNFDPARPTAYDPTAVPKVVNDVAAAADRMVLMPIDKADPAVKVDVEGLKGIRRDLRADPKKSTTLYRDVPNTTILRKD